MDSVAGSAARKALGPALVAAALAVVAALALRYFFSLPMPAELFADQATTRIPLPLFEAMLATFGTAAKHLYLIGVLIGVAALTTLLGVAYAAIRSSAIGARKPRNASAAGIPSAGEALSYADAPIIVLALWLLSTGALAPLLGGGWFGADLEGGVTAALLSQLAPDIVFALSFIWQTRSSRRAWLEGLAAQEPGARLSRRLLLQQTTLAAVTLAGGIAVWQALTSGLGALVGASPPHSAAPQVDLSNLPTRISPPPVPVYTDFAPVTGQAPEVTAAANFYYVSKNLVADPEINGQSWQLAFTGMVEKPYTLTYAQLRALPQVTQYHTLECISNEVGGDLMSNGFFTGVSLADALNAAGIRQDAASLIFKAADGYSDSLHLAQALDERSLIVYLLDGQPLPTSHGYPARLLIPGLYGMKNGKWLTELSLAASDYSGYWEQRGWTREAVVKMTSRIDTPHDGDLLVARPMSVAGVAYAGDQGIARVDVSVDTGKTWTPAKLRRPLGALAWTLWEYPWTPAPGTHTLLVRAIDSTGAVQSYSPAPPLPDGASGYHTIMVTAR